MKISLRRISIEWLRNVSAAIAALVLIGYVAFSITQSVVIWRMQNQVNAPLDVFASAVLTPIDKYSYLPDIVATHPIVLDTFSGTGDPQQLNLFLEQLTGIVKAEAVFIMDHAGLTIASSNWRSPQTFVGNNFAFRPYFQDAVKHGRGRFYGIGAVTYSPGYFLSHAIKKADQVIGVAVIKIDLSKLDEKWDPSLGYMTIVDKNGIVFLSSKKNWRYRPLKPLPAQTMERLKTTKQYAGMLVQSVPLLAEEQNTQGGRIVRVQELTDQGATREGGRYVLRTDKLPGSDWTVSVFYPTDKVSSTSMQVALVTTTAFAFLLLLFMYAQQVRKRIEEREAARLSFESAHRTLEARHQELAELSKQLQEAAITDPLTGAHNRRYFLDTIARMDSEARRHNTNLAIMMLDIDFFKKVNDTHGHAVGDDLLKEVTRICRESLRESDLFARFGGEEYVFALPKTDVKEAHLVAERIRKSVMGMTMPIEHGSLQITVSIGISRCGNPAISVNEALRHADEALYTAKGKGRNRVVIHTGRRCAA
jgi:two-component system C4-dicarboxylate transport sensor histidine kinase DctB